jgi:RimJ/RimL family protein N-acetyltransferase
MYTFNKIDENSYNEILTWKYEGELSIYDLENHETTLSELMDNDNYDFFVGISEEDELVGYLECFFKEDGTMEIGHGLNPTFMGKGLSYDFISESIDFAIEFYDYNNETIIICVEPFNAVAKKVYSRIGFDVVEEEDEFIQMELHI